MPPTDVELSLSRAGGGVSPQGAVHPLERALALRAQAGDPRAFRQVFERYAKPLHRFLSDLLRDAAAADEATQETFVRAHRRLPELADAAKLSAFLYGIARNVAREQRRARGRVAPADQAAMDAPDRAPDPETALLGREADAMLQGALAVLDEDRRAALMLRIDHDLGYDDIAEIMGWPLSKVKNEIHRARLSLRAHLQAYLGETS
jgi:RNA polymerase sigma-70 factor (ECF subfamily)